MTDPFVAAAPAVSVDHLDALPVGARLGEFEILALLGVGGFGMVYKAFDHSLHRHVAIKEYMPAALAARVQGLQLSVRASADLPTFQAGLASFVEEARLLAQFDHPSLVKVFRFWEANNTAYMVMPLYQGMTLKQARAFMRKPPSEAWLRKVLWAVLDALRVLHENDTLHRDISPDNIFLQDAGPPVLLDLGAARHAISAPAAQLTAILKVNYAPIEQYTQESGEAPLPQGPWSDLYALAAVVHGCICNDTPLPATLRAIRDRMVRFARVARTVKRQFGVEYSDAFVAAISQALEVQPGKRPQSIDAFLARMEMQVPPEGLAHFDWKAELGSAWESSPESAQEAAADADLPTRLMEHPAGEAAVDLDFGAMHSAAAPPAASGSHGDTVFVAETVAAPPPRIAQQRSRARRQVWGAAALAGLALAVAGWWGLRPMAAVSSEGLVTQAPAPPAPPAEAPTPAAPAPTEEIIEEYEPAPAPAPAPVAVAASAPRPALQRRAARPAPAEPVPTPPPAAAPEKPVAVPAPTVKPAPPPRGPEEACADANFLTRPMCIHNECQKPALSSHPVCVEARRRYEADARRQSMSP